MNLNQLAWTLCFYLLGLNISGFGLECSYDSILADYHLTSLSKYILMNFLEVCHNFQVIMFTFIWWKLMIIIIFDHITNCWTYLKYLITNEKYSSRECLGCFGSIRRLLVLIQCRLLFSFLANVTKVGKSRLMRNC